MHCRHRKMEDLAMPVSILDVLGIAHARDATSVDSASLEFVAHI